MAKIRITGLPKVKKGMVANGPCQPGYIKVDGECIPESTRNFTVYETDVPGEYTRTQSIGKPALLSNVDVKGNSKWDRMSASEQLNALDNGYDPYSNRGLDYQGGDPASRIRTTLQKKNDFDKDTDKYIQLYTDGILGGSEEAKKIKEQYNQGKLDKNKLSEILNKSKEFEDKIRFTQGYNPSKPISDQMDLIYTFDDNAAKRQYAFNLAKHQDYASQLGLGNQGGLSEGINLGVNTLSDILISPPTGAALVGNNVPSNAYTKDRATWNGLADVTGVSNYPYLNNALENFKTEATGDWKNHPFKTAGKTALAGMGVGFEFAGSMPIVGEIERGAAGMITKESQKIAAEIAKDAKKIPWSKATPTQRGYKILKAPLKGLNYATFGNPILNAGFEMGASPAYAYDRLLGDAGKEVTMNQMARGMNFSGNAVDWSPVTTPIEQGVEQGVNFLFGKGKKEPYNVKAPMAPPVENNNAPNVYLQNPIAKDTAINLRLPDGAIYNTTTQDPNFTNLRQYINLDQAQWHPESKSFNIDSTFTDEKGTISTKPIMDYLFKSRKKTYGGMNEIPRLFTYPPERNAPGRMAYGGMPRFIAGGTPPNCDPGYMADPTDSTKCIPDPNYIPAVGLTPTTSMVEGAANQIDPRPDTETHPLFNEADQPLDPNTGSPFEIPTVNLNRRRNHRKFNETSGITREDDRGDAPCPPEHYDPITKKCNEPLTGRQKIQKGFDNFGSFYNRVTTPLANAANMYTNDQRQKDFDTKSRESKFNNYPVANTNHGLTEDPNNGLRRNNYGQIGYKWNNQASGYGEYGGTMLNNNSMGKLRIRITGGPVSDDAEQMAYGGQSGYGFDLGQRNTYAAMPQTKMQTVSKQIQEVPREEANIEAEKGETVYGDINGDGQDEHMDIGGKRHVDGGTPLSVPEGSFIFSDTKNMRIKDEASLSKFGLSPRKEGYTPAEIAKKYDINKYKAILEDENSDELMKNTAQLMIKNYKKKLAELALIQESMKGFPQGIPEMCRGVLSDELLGKIDQHLEQEGKQKPKFEEGSSKLSSNPAQQQSNNAESQEPMPDNEQAPGDAMQDQMIDEEEAPGMMYGGSYAYGGDFNHFAEGGQHLDKYQLGTQVVQNPWQKKIDKIKALNKNVTWSSRYGAGDTDIPATQAANNGVYGDIKTADIEDFKKRHGWFFDVYGDWDAKNVTDVLKFQSAYNKRARNNFGLDFDFFDLNSTAMDKLDGMFGEYTYNAPTLDGSPPPAPDKIPGVKCLGRDKDGIPSFDHKDFDTEAARTAEGYSADEATAGKECQPKSTTPGKKWICAKDEKGKPYPKESTTGYDSEEEALRNCGEDKIPFDYMTPDKWKMNAVRSRRLNKYLPYIADTPYEAGNYLPEEWRGKAAELQSQTNDAARSLGAMGPAQGFNANLSAIQGKQARNLIGAISDVDARNVQGFNAYNKGELARRDQFGALRASNATERAKGNTIANQYADNAYNKNIEDIANVDANAWLNRMQLDMENQTNKHYYTDPWTGRLHYRKGYGPADLGNNSSNNSSSTPEDFKKFQTDYGADKTWDDYIKFKRYQSGLPANTGKYGGSLRNNQINNSVNLGDMLSRGYGFPF